MGNPARKTYKAKRDTLAEAIKITESKFGYMYFYNNKTQQFTLNSLSKEETDDKRYHNSHIAQHPFKTWE